MSIIIAFGRYGGFFIARGWSTRIALGWMAITFMPVDFDIVFQKCIGIMKSAEENKPHISLHR